MQLNHSLPFPCDQYIVPRVTKDISKPTILYLRQLSVSSSEATQALLEERVDLGLLYGGGQVHGVQRAGVVVTACPREGKRNHRRLLPLGQEMQESEPHRSVLEGKRQRWMRR